MAKFTLQFRLDHLAHSPSMYKKLTHQHYLRNSKHSPFSKLLCGFQSDIMTKKTFRITFKESLNLA